MRKTTVSFRYASKYYLKYYVSKNVYFVCHVQNYIISTL